MAQEPQDVIEAQSNRGVLALLVVIVVAVVVTGVVRHVRHERHLDRDALAHTFLQNLDSQAAQTGPLIDVRVQNQGIAPLTLLSLQVDRAGYPLQQLHTTVRPEEILDIAMTVKPDCEHGPWSSGPSVVNAVVKTSRGQTKTVPLHVGEQAFAANYAQSQRLLCHFFDVDQSVSSKVLSLVTKRGTAHLVVQLFNLSKDQRSITSLRVADGFAITGPQLPIVLPGFGTPSPRITLDVSLTSCPTAFTSTDSGDQGVFMTVVDERGQGAVRANLPLDRDVQALQQQLYEGAC